jgi:hypothetical protein
MMKNINWEQVCLSGMEGSNRGSEYENANTAGENNVDCIFYVKGIIHHESVT